MDRRTFLRTLGAAGASTALGPHDLLGRALDPAAQYFGVHPFIERHPEAVFIQKTSVDTKLNSSAAKMAGSDFARTVFVPMGEPGASLTHSVVIKPNLTCRGKWSPAYTIEASMGVVTDAFFVEGIIESLKTLGISGSQFYLREVNCPQDFADGGYVDMAARTGADLRNLSGQVSTLPPESIQWRDVPDGVWFNRIPYLWPVNAPNTFLLNIAKLKAHSMGLTLCAKNLQGTMASGYVAHCTEYGKAMSVAANHCWPDANAVIMDHYNRHVALRVPRWDRPGSRGGLWMETWATRCLDNNSVTKPALHIIEGIYGRDGNFMDGPAPNGLATDYMTNVLIFGKNPFYVDAIGHWIGGHEPGNFGLFHMAVERGMASTFDPARIPLYEWTLAGEAVRRKHSDFVRTPLRTLYLRRDYNSQTEPLYHLVDEPYEYPPVASVAEGTTPQAFELRQNFPNPFNGSTTIEFELPQDGEVRIEVVDLYGQVIERLAEGRHAGGFHLLRWDGTRRPSGVYFVRMLSGGRSAVRRMVLIR
jgi:uncharacterized protein (DUF362 family)